MTYKNAFILSLITLAFGIIYNMPSIAGTYNVPFFEKEQKEDTKQFRHVFLENLFKETSDQSERNKSEKEKELSKVIDEESFIRNTVPFTAKPFPEDDLEYTFRLPKSWTKSSSSMERTPELSRKLLADLARFHGPIIKDSRPGFMIQVIQLEHEILAEHWLRNYLFSSGYTLQGDVQIKNEVVSEANYIYLKGTLAYYVTVKAQIYNNLIVLVRLELPLNYKDEFEFLQARTIKSFKLLTSSTSESIEEFKPFALMDSLRFDHPTSWQERRPDFRDPNHLTVELQNKTIGGELNGIIYFDAIKRKSTIKLQEQLNSLRTKLKDVNKLVISQIISSEAAPVYDRFDFARQEVYIVNFKERSLQNQELHLVVLADQHWYILIYMLTPVKDEAYYSWARNTRTFNLLIQSIQ